MELLIGWVLFAVVVAIIARNRRRDPVGWFILSVVISPLLSLILVLALGPPALPSVRRGGKMTEAEKSCPRCAEMVRANAVICRFCGHEFEPGRDDLSDRALVRRYTYQGAKIEEFSDGTFVLHTEPRPRRFESRAALSKYLRLQPQAS